MKKTFILLCIALFAMGACATEPAIEPFPEDLPPPPPAPEPEKEVQAPPVPEPEEEAEEVTDASEVLAGEKTLEGGADILDVRCDREPRSLSFTIVNTGDNDWELNQQVPWPPPKGLVGVKVIFNNYEMNGLTDYFDPDTRERYFGPSETFSENCGGVEVLEPEASATCTVGPVPLKEGMLQDKNHLVVNAMGGDATFSFIC